jgi:hypothetical protein
MGHRMTSYLVGMGVSLELLHIMQLVPREELRVLTADEAVRLNLATSYDAHAASQFRHSKLAAFSTSPDPL